MSLMLDGLRLQHHPLPPGAIRGGLDATSPALCSPAAPAAGEDQGSAELKAKVRLV